MSNQPNFAAPVLTAPDLTALVASRICHDLISPIGAIGNGVELLGIDRPGPELDLLSESATHANARIRFFRISFGAATSGQRIARAEVVTLLAALSHGGRIAFDWTSSDDLPRPTVRAVFLLLQCLESALAYGGTVTVIEQSGHWTIRGTGPRLRIDRPIWSLLAGAPPPTNLAAAHIQFALAPLAIAQTGRRLTQKIDETAIRLTF